MRLYLTKDEHGNYLLHLWKSKDDGAGFAVTPKTEKQRQLLDEAVEQTKDLVPPCPRCGGKKWVCEVHDDQPWPHEGCGGAGMPCPLCQHASTRPNLGPGWGSSSTTLLLRVGLEMRCARCSRSGRDVWHALEQPYADDTTAAKSHLYITCPKAGGKYFVGIVGTEPRPEQQIRESQ